MAQKRLIWADSLKGWLILLVVLGHAIQNTLGDACETNHLWNIIYSFHMAAFMAVSGYVAFRQESNWGGVFCCTDNMEEIPTTHGAVCSMDSHLAVDGWKH